MTRSISNAWDEGRQAFLEGKDYWENPYANPTAQIKAYTAWSAGWTFAKQEEKTK